MSNFRGVIYDSIVDTIGATPLVRLSKLAAACDCRADVVGKLEFFNPLASVKDRIGIALIETAERAGRIKPGTLLIEPTSGNTGIGLAFVAAAKGYPLVLCMPESASIERRKMVGLLGAKVELTPASEGMGGAIRRAEALKRNHPDSLILQQFDNPANPDAHRHTTAEEIWNDTAGRVDIIVSGIGTGGTITGIGQTLKARKPELQMIGVEPSGSAVLSGGKPGPHKQQGIGSGFLSSILDLSVVDEIVTATDEDAIQTARQAAALEGVPIGISSGAALSVALRVGRRPGNAGKLIVVIVPSFAERYLSTELFADV
ncbi:cysteine synthase A [Paraburkholderia xenovorans LB400]|uniref:Cysteine synthase n=1 Tax=Paraburkholderia xenovorans (strain LB400) TaxID=266265 RepID=Q13IC4_PARXL|nr:cysteine synthase A [Paraburkholderia xenovorans]ABE36165.1 cysteine synthase [Paraburkholderia xenovorans LB400]AIP34603.1 cysteine synthase A [Paraburkholderia xenovorans LB400]